MGDSVVVHCWEFYTKVEQYNNNNNITLDIELLFKHLDSYVVLSDKYKKAKQTLHNY